MMSALVRPTGSGLRSTRNAIVPSPCPADPPVIAIQPAALDADHEHSRETLTGNALVPPSEPNDRGDASKLGWQRSELVDGAVTLVDAEPPHAVDRAATPTATTIRITTCIDRTTCSAMHICRQQ
jgi:hypothetical protein